MIKWGPSTSFLPLLSGTATGICQLVGDGAWAVLSVGPNIIYVTKSPERPS